MSHAVVLAGASTASLARCGARSRKEKGEAKEKQSSVGFGTKRRDSSWQCAQGCGACCKLDKGPSFATPEEIFTDPADVQLYRSLIGPDGWCLHFEQTTRTCSIYSDRPYFCRVEPDIFQALYGINEKRFNKEACCFCRDTIKEIYGAQSQELDSFNRTIRNSNFGVEPRFSSTGGKRCSIDKFSSTEL